MTKLYARFISALFCLFIFGFGILLFATPDREFSEQENRYLAQFEAPTWESIVSGEFMESFEDYVVDQFPLRDEWIALKARCEKLLGKQENNAVYFGTDDKTLFAQITIPTVEDFSKRIDYLNRLGDKLDVPVWFSLIPDKSFVWADRLPENAVKVDDGSMNVMVHEFIGADVGYIDMTDALHGDDVFYRTDHHWTTMGAFQGYVALMEAMGRDWVQPAGEPTQVSDRFFGTTWSSSGASWIAPDVIHTWVGEEGGIEVERWPEGRPIKGELYDESFLEKKDKYSMFLGGNQPLCVLRNDAAGGSGKLLVVRDSYSDSIAPFLAQSYEEVHLLDLRYYKMPLSAYVAQNGIDEVLVLYSAANFTTDNNLFLLGM